MMGTGDESLERKCMIMIFFMSIISSMTDHVRSMQAHFSHIILKMLL